MSPLFWEKTSAGGWSVTSSNNMTLSRRHTGLRCSRYLLLLNMLGLFFCASLQAAPQQLAVLTVEVIDIDPQAGGLLLVGLFRGEESWPKLKNALQLRQVAPNSKRLSVQFPDLPYADNYAVEIHHDENTNGKFDMRWLPYPRPKEGVGVSNNRFGFGHPDFSDARFSIDSPQKSIQIRMHY